MGTLDRTFTIIGTLNSTFKLYVSQFNILLSAHLLPCWL